MSALVECIVFGCKCEVYLEVKAASCVHIPSPTDVINSRTGSLLLTGRAVPKSTNKSKLKSLFIGSIKKLGA